MVGNHPQNFILWNGTVLSCTVILHHVVSYRTIKINILFSIMLYSKALNHIIPYPILSKRIPLYDTVPYHTLPYCAVLLHCDISCFIVSNNFIPNCIVPYHIS